MRNLLGNISLTSFIIAVMLLVTIMSPAAEAKRPGDSSGDDGVSTGNTVFIAAGVCIIAGVTIYLVTRGSGDDEERPDEEDSEADSLQSSILEGQLPADGKFAGDSAPVFEAERKLPVSPFVALSRDETITVGLSFSF
jgi:hypothetical protein